MKPRRTTQPLRATAKRRQGVALQAAQRGAPRYSRNPMDAKRAIQRKRKRRLSASWGAHPLVSILARRRTLGRR